jgi:antitoxin (DNA-binding transcriptional repressor) of toxin-antitoxin stability system
MVDLRQSSIADCRLDGLSGIDYAHFLQSAEEANDGSNDARVAQESRGILDAIGRGETVIWTHYGRSVARIEPIRDHARPSAADHPAFGMWAEREDMVDPSEYIRNMRRGRLK